MRIRKKQDVFGAVGTMATEYTEANNAYYNAPYINDLISSGNTGDDYYVKFPDGTLICYGLCPGTNTAHNTTSTESVSFAETFINQPSINLTIRAGNDQSTQYLSAAVKSDDNLSGFTFRTRNSNTSSTGADYGARVYYQAIGKWK